jgi:hypothetical protein
VTESIKLKETPSPILEMKGRDGEVERVQLVIVERAADGDEDVELTIGVYAHLHECALSTKEP